MNRSFRRGLVLLAGLTLLGAALALPAIMLELRVATVVLAGARGPLALAGLVGLRGELTGLVQRRRGEVALFALGVVSVLIGLAWLSVRFPVRLDLTSAGLYSLSPATVTMLKRLDAPVHVVFFHDPMMRDTVELYQLVAAQTPKVTVEFYDPMVNPAQARMLGVGFAGTAVM